MAVSWIGKLKTSVQMGALVVLIGFEPGHVLYTVGMVGLYAAALLTLWSMMAYLRAAWPSLSAHS